MAKSLRKEDLQRQIWGGALVEDSNLPRCIMALRKALDPAPDGGSYIETVARLGYRLTVAVEEVEAEDPEPQSAPEPLALAAAPGSPRRHRWCGFAAALLLLHGLVGRVVCTPSNGQDRGRRCAAGPGAEVAAAVESEGRGPGGGTDPGGARHDTRLPAGTGGVGGVGGATRPVVI